MCGHWKPVPRARFKHRNWRFDRLPAEWWVRLPHASANSLMIRMHLWESSPGIPSPSPVFVPNLFPIVASRRSSYARFPPLLSWLGALRSSRGPPLPLACLTERDLQIRLDLRNRREHDGRGRMVACSASDVG